MNESVMIAATGTPAASSTTPSAVAAAEHEPQSPTPVMITSFSAISSLMTFSGSGTAKFSLVRFVTVTPYWSSSRRPTSSRNGRAFCLVLISRPTLLPSRLARRGARGAAGLAALVVTVPVGSRIAFGMSTPCLQFSARSPPGGCPLARGHLLTSADISVLVHQDAANVLTIHKVSVSLVNFIQAVFLGNEFRELDAAFVPQAEDHRDVVERIGATEQ